MLTLKVDFENALFFFWGGEEEEFVVNDHLKKRAL